MSVNLRLISMAMNYWTELLLYRHFISIFWRLKRVFYVRKHCLETGNFYKKEGGNSSTKKVWRHLIDWERVRSFALPITIRKSKHKSVEEGSRNIFRHFIPSSKSVWNDLRIQWIYSKQCRKTHVTCYYFPQCRLYIYLIFRKKLLTCDLLSMES